MNQTELKPYQRKPFEDRVRQPLNCESCGRLLAKMDTDGTVHFKPSRGPELIIAGSDFRVLFRCDPSYPKVGVDGRFEKVYCGKTTIFSKK